MFFEQADIVEKYAKTRTLYPSERWILKAIPMRTIDSVLDFGCAAGGFRNLFPQAEYTGVDRSKPMLERAEVDHPGSTFLEMMPIEGSYDLVLSLGTLHHMTNWQNAIINLWAITKRYLMIDLRLNQWGYHGTYAPETPYVIVDYGEALETLTSLKSASLTLHGYHHLSQCKEQPTAFMGVFLLSK